MARGFTRNQRDPVAKDGYRAGRPKREDENVPWIPTEFMLRTMGQLEHIDSNSDEDMEYMEELSDIDEDNKGSSSNDDDGSVGSVEPTTGVQGPLHIPSNLKLNNSMSDIDIDTEEEEDGDTTVEGSSDESNLNTLHSMSDIDADEDGNATVEGSSNEGSVDSTGPRPTEPRAPKKGPGRDHDSLTSSLSTSPTVVTMANSGSSGGSASSSKSGVRDGTVAAPPPGRRWRPPCPTRSRVGGVWHQPGPG